MDELLTASQRRTINTNIALCGQCRARLDLAKTLGRDDQELRDRVDHLEAAGRSALQLADMARTGGR